MLKKSYRVGWVVVVVAHKILVSAPDLLEFFGLSHDLGMGIGTWA